MISNQRIDRRLSRRITACQLVGYGSTACSDGGQRRSSSEKEQVSLAINEQVPTIDTFGCSRFHPFGNGKPQKRTGPATRKRRKLWRCQAPPFPESVIHRELAFQAQIPRQSRQRVLVLSCAINRYKGRRVRARGLQARTLAVGRVPHKH